MTREPANVVELQVRLGSPPDEHGWPITIRDPFEAGKAADVVYLKNYSLAVSGNYERFFTLHGKPYAHIMDPRTGLPVERRGCQPREPRR